MTKGCEDMKRSKLAIMTIAVSVILSSSFSVYADSLTVYTVNDLSEMAYEKDLNHLSLEKTIDDLWKQRNLLLENSRRIQDQMDEIESYRKLFEKKSSELTASEKLSLKMYQIMYGETPPTYTGQEILDYFIKNKDFSHANLLVEITKLENSKKLIEQTLKENIYNLGMQFINLNETFEAQKSYTNILLKQLDATRTQYKLGKISETALKNAESNYQIAVYQLKSIQNSQEILKLNLCKIVGLNGNQKFIIKDEYLISENYKIQSLDVYIDSALKNRAEILNAQSEYDTKKRQFEVIQSYLSDKLLTDVLSYQNSYLEAQNELNDAQNTVKSEIIDLYSQIIREDQSLKLSLKQYKVALENNKATNLMFKQGKIKETDLALANYKFLTVYNAYKAENRKMGLLLRQLSYATNLGPAIGGNQNAK